MKYNGKDIGKPSIRQIESCLNKLGKSLNKFSAEKIYKELEKRHWSSSIGKPIYNLENYIHGICSSNSKRYFSDEYLAKKSKQSSTNKKEIKGSYSEQLKDYRWKAFRQFVFVVRGCKCEVCRCAENLQIHHNKYIKGRAAWEYTCNDVMVVCKDCHQKIHNLK